MRKHPAQTGQGRVEPQTGHGTVITFGQADVIEDEPMTV